MFVLAIPRREGHWHTGVPSQREGLESRVAEEFHFRNTGETMRKLLAVLIVGMLVWWSIGAAMAAGPRKLDVASTFPLGLTVLSEGGQMMIDKVEAMSNKKIRLRLHGSGDLVPAFEVFNNVSSGALLAGWDWIGYWSGTVPVAGLLGAMPFGPDPQTFAGWVYNGGGVEILQKEYDKYNIKVLPCSIIPAEGGGWFNKEINSVEDLKGLKMRISGLGAKVLTKYGVSTQLIPGGEIYLALERGRIDATEFSLPEIDKQLGFYRIAKYRYFPGWHQPASINSFIMNMDVWKKYSAQEQSWFLNACKANITDILNIPVRQGVVIDELKTKGVQYRRFPESVLAAMRRTSREVLEEEASKDAGFKAAYESLLAYMKKTDTWNKLQVIPRD